MEILSNGLTTKVISCQIWFKNKINSIKVEITEIKFQKL